MTGSAGRTRPPGLRDETERGGFMRKSIDRLVVLGLDGATWTVLDPMRRRGLMPNLDALLEGAAHGTLTSTIPPVTTAAWTTMMTGCNPPRHGVFDHRYYDAAAGRMKVNHSGRIRVPTVWHQLADAGRTVVCLNLPGLFPPPSLRGVVVSGMDAPHLEAALAGLSRVRGPAQGRGPRLLAPLLLEARAAVARGADGQRPADRRELSRPCRGGLLADRHVPDWSVLMVQFQNLDPFQHRVWRYLNVDETGHRRARVERRGGRGDPRPGRGDRPALRAGRPPRRGGHGRQRPRLRSLPGPDRRQPDPGRRRRRPAAPLGRQPAAGG